jgi:hypothetical protein
VFQSANVKSGKKKKKGKEPHGYNPKPGDTDDDTGTDNEY